MLKKYQIFVSSTFNDLLDERQDTIRSVLDLGHIPAGMEIFPAADTEQFEYIKKIIDECDYYVLIIGARYGSVDEAGVSFTEREYEYALSKGLPVLVFPHGDVGLIPNAKSETDPHALARLNAFRAKAIKGRLVRFWKTREELRSKVLVSLMNAFNETPGDGWIRATRANIVAEPGTIGSAEPIIEDEKQKATPHTNSVPAPRDDWTRQQFEMAALDALLLEDVAAMATIDAAFASSSHSQGDGAISWRSHKELVGVYANKAGHLDRLVELANSNPGIAELSADLGHAYSYLDEYRLAAEAYLRAGQIEKDIKKRGLWLRHAATHFARDGDVARAMFPICELRNDVDTKASNEIRLLEALLEIAELREDRPEMLALLERIVELRPDDLILRFKLAHAQSEAGNFELALYHYLKIPFADRNSGTWNNLGVLFQRFNLEAKAVDAYRRAADMNEALAMANLANKFLNAGFVREARLECDRAFKQGDVPALVGDVVSKLSSVDEEEDARQKDALTTAKAKMDFFRSMGRAISRHNSINLAKNWRGPDCQLQAEVGQEKIELFGAFERERNPLTLAIVGGDTLPATKSTHTVRYVGDFHGGAVVGSVKRTQEGESLLSSAGSSKKIYMAINEDGTEIAVMELSETLQPIFYKLIADVTAV